MRAGFLVLNFPQAQIPPAAVCQCPVGVGFKGIGLVSFRALSKFGFENFPISCNWSLLGKGLEGENFKFSRPFNFCLWVLDMVQDFTV